MVFSLSLGVINYLQKLDDQEIRGTVISASDYAVQLQFVPAHDDIYCLKSELWEWIDNQLVIMDGGTGS